jgi:hypothetical protein
MTPLGWARANIMYDAMRDVPPPGSPMESVMILVWQMRQEIDFYTVRAIIQSEADDSKDGKPTQDAWKAVVDAFYPYMKEQRRKSDLAAMNFLKREVARGAFRIRPLVPVVKSRLAQRRKKTYERPPDYPVMSRLRKRQGSYRDGRRS